MPPPNVPSFIDKEIKEYKELKESEPPIQPTMVSPKTTIRAFYSPGELNLSKPKEEIPTPTLSPLMPKFVIPHPFINIVIKKPLLNSTF